MDQPHHDDTPPAPAGKVYRNAAIAIAIAWSMRLIGLFSVLVLARVLTPADFGIVALAMSVIALVDIFSALGLRQALLRVQEPDRSHYDTVWTIQLLVLLVLAGVVVALGPVMAWFYDQPALTLVIAALALRFVFFGLANVGLVDFDRHLQLGRDLNMRLVVRLITFVATLAAALILRNYWALVIGAVLHSVVHAIASYVVHPYRPRFSLKRRAEMLGVSLWMFLSSAAQTVNDQIERFVVAWTGSLNVLGFYAVSKDLSAIFTQEIATALNRVTFVTTARTGKPLGADPERLQAMLGAYAMIAAPLGLGLAATAERTVLVLLGPQWTGAAPFLLLIAPAAALYAVFKLVVSSLQATGDAKQAAYIAIGGTGLVATGVAIAAGTGGGPLQVAFAALVACMVLLPVSIFVLARVARTGARALFLAAGRPFLAALAMLWFVRVWDVPAAPPLVVLTAQVLAGAAAYAAVLALTWLVSGRPPGAEANTLAVLRSGWRELRVQGRASR